MHKTMRFALTALALATGLVATAHAQSNRTARGAFNGLNWEASSMLTGVTNTQTGGPITNGGDPIYWPSYPRDSGVVHLLMDFGGPDNQFICSGTLLSDRMSILTAGHCVSSGFNTATPVSTTVYFQPAAGVAPGTRIQTGGIANGGAETRLVTNYAIHPSYTGDVIDHNDIAVLRLDSPAPAQANSYGLYTNNNLTGSDFTVHGYGLLGDGANGTTNFAARLRNGDNRYDFRLGDTAFGNQWALVLGEPMGQISNSWVSDFDNGLGANDTSCLVASDPFLAGANGAQFCNLGRGAREAGVASGDSGGPSFINGMISSVNSYGLTFGEAYGDVGPAGCDVPANQVSCLNSSFGEFSGYVPVYLHESFITAQMVPEPGTYALMGLGLFAVGTMARRRRQQA